MDAVEFPPAWLVFSPILGWFVSVVVGIALGFRWWPFAVSMAYSIAVAVYVVASY